MKKPQTKQQPIMCDCCGLNPATVKDYRDFSDLGSIEQSDYLVCANCLNLNNFWFSKLMGAKTARKKEIIEEIAEDDWNVYLIK